MSISDFDFKDSPEHDDWIESGGRDEDYDDYYNIWARRISVLCYLGKAVSRMFNNN